MAYYWHPVQKYYLAKIEELDCKHYHETDDNVKKTIRQQLHVVRDMLKEFTEMLERKETEEYHNAKKQLAYEEAKLQSLEISLKDATLEEEKKLFQEQIEETRKEIQYYTEWLAEF